MSPQRPQVGKNNRREQRVRKRCPATGKASFRSRKEASKVRDRLLAHRVGQPKDTPRGLYECWHCGDWHLTSQEQPR